MSSQQPSRMSRIALTGRILGTLLYIDPTSPEAQPLIETLQQTGWADEWPTPPENMAALADEITRGLTQDGEETLAEAFQRLFIGPYALPAPPWGSVWLDKENVLFGHSMMALRHWMRGLGIESHREQNEPDDHIGTLLMLCAWLAEQEYQQQVDELLAWHILPWSGRFLEVFTAEANHPFYRALGELTSLTLAQWQQELLIPVAQKELFR